MEPLGILAVGKTKSSTLQTCSEIAKVFLATAQGLCVTAVVSVEACVCNHLRHVENLRGLFCSLIWFVC